MSQIPEHLIELLMQMTGESRSSVEKKAEQAFAEVFANKNKYSVKPKKTSKKKPTYTFQYDFGNSWEHDIRLSSIADYQEDEPHQITFLGGKCACPPEDCGGIWGYEELLETLSKLKSGHRLTSEERDHLEWAGWDKDYDPEYLDLDGCQVIVQRYN